MKKKKRDKKLERDLRRAQFFTVLFLLLISGICLQL